MNRRLRLRPLLLFIGLASLPVGCEYAKQNRPAPRNVLAGQLPTSNLSKTAQGTVTSLTQATLSAADTTDQREKREAILSNVLRLIETAGITPGGDNFLIATQNLNQYFEQGTAPADYVLSPESRQFVSSAFNEAFIKELESKSFEKIDARHIEDCMLYHAIASRVGGEGDDLTQARRIFDWMVRHVQLVPPQALAGPEMEQAQARPYDVLVRGMATEANQGYWTERGWVFMALCRQIGIDVGLVSYTPNRPPAFLSNRPELPGQDQPVVWVCAALIDGKAYLFDHRLGIAVPDAKGDGVATLDAAMTNPEILARLDMPGQSNYGTTRADLASATSKLAILLDSSRGYASPKMQLLQSRLVGKNRTVLFRDPAEVRAHFNQVIGPKLTAVNLWQLPLIVEMNLFNNPQFVASTLYARRLFDGRLPLLYARMAQLKGDLPDAIQQYVAIRFVSGAIMRDKKTPIVPIVQRELDVYATYFLGLCHLEQKNNAQAERFFKQTLSITPTPAPNREFCFMFRWGANTNLGLLNLDRGDLPNATRYLSQPDVPLSPTPQSIGNIWLAREALWRNPIAPVGDLLPPAPIREDLSSKTVSKP